MQVFLLSVAWLMTVTLPTSESADINCGEPLVIESATVNETPKKVYSLGATITYACQFGYSTRGRNTTLKCEKSDAGNKAEWTQPLFSCSPVSCGDPGFVDNGHRLGSLFTFPNSVKYECNSGYKLKGLNTRYCQTSGLWSGRLPACEEITCHRPQNPDNGVVTYSSLVYGSELSYKCNKGFRLTTEETISCNLEGQWSNTDVQCVESVCDIPLQPEHGSVQLLGSDPSPRAGSIAIFACDNDRLADGPTTSKCLDSGDWTVPTPKCLEPCSVPYVSNGAIGKFERRRRQLTFRVIPVGNRINDDSELYIRCQDGYEVPGTEKKELWISCSRGKWSVQPVCEPAFCREEPPYAQNAKAIALDQEHGGKVSYECGKDFKKMKPETVICDFGKWKGSPPACKSTSCSIDELKFPGLLKGRKSLYKDGEIFDVQCDSRYQLTNTKQPQLSCLEGYWRGTLPPCVAANCTKPPPQIELGRAEAPVATHTSVVKYVCEDPYVPVGNTKVQCLFGEWTGQPPKCVDSRCYLKNLHQSNYIEKTASPSVTLSRLELHVTCKEGYIPRSERPLCLNGTWTRNSVSPCVESDCTVPFVHFGEIKEEKLGDYHWNFWKVRWDRNVDYLKIPIDTRIPYGSSRHLFCYKGYTFQGTSQEIQGITCTKGRWFPDPVCLLKDQKYIPRTTSAGNRAVTSPPATTDVIQSKCTSKATTGPTSAEKISPTEMTNFETTQTDELCECEYLNDDQHLFAHADGKRLKFRDKVKNGTSVTFRCTKIGYLHRSGPQVMKCENCRSWHLSEFPTCIGPNRDDAVILYGKTFNISIEGNLEAMKGQIIKLTCVVIYGDTYPSWSVPNKTGVTIKQERKDGEDGEVFYMTHLEIQKAGTENAGTYGCTSGNDSKNTVNLVIIDPDLRCSEIPEEDGIRVTYELDRQVRSQASFSCSNDFKELSGKSSVVCLLNAEWSDLPPKCIDKKCKELKGNELLLINYSGDRKIGSRATFHCFQPGQRNGASFAECLENGTWSHPVPTCRIPPCSVKDLYSSLPQNVVPIVDNLNETIPYNGTVKLLCSENMILEGSQVAKCGQKREWIVENVQCNSECPPLLKPSESETINLIIKPLKNGYKLGEMVYFSCPPGMNLNGQTQVAICLKYGWSETVLPECK